MKNSTAITTKLSPERRRLLEAASPAEAGRLLLAYLATSHERRNALAVELLVRLGAPAVAVLLREALGPGKRPAHRVRLLDVVQKIGLPLDAGQWLTLVSAKASFGGAVREKIREVLAALGSPDRAAPSPFNTSVLPGKVPSLGTMPD